MEDEKFKEMVEFESQHDCTVLSPFFARQLEEAQKAEEQLKKKQHFFYVAWQDTEGRIIDIKHYDDYDTALMRAMQNAKLTGTTYTIRDLAGRFIDGNYAAKEI